MKIQGQRLLCLLPKGSGQALLVDSAQAQDSLDFKDAEQQAAALHQQHAVLHWLIQRVGEKHLHDHWLLHLSLVQHLEGGPRVRMLGTTWRLPATL